MTVPDSKTTPDAIWADDAARGIAPSDLMLVLATILYGLSVRSGTLTAIASLAATFALAAGIWLRRRGRGRGLTDPTATDLRILAGVGLFGILGSIGWAPSSVGPTTSALEHLPGAIFLTLAFAGFVTRRSSSRFRFVVLAASCLLTVGYFGSAHIETTGDLGFDVYWLHVGAAEAVANGDNPYTDAVEVDDGSPNAGPGDVISGYVYPPITGLSYAVGHWLTPDARYTSLFAWLVVLALLAFRAIQRRSNRHLYVMMLLASVPGLWLVLRAAWTEPLSIMFMALAVTWWSTTWVSGSGLGAMLASKQYFLVTGPALLLHRDTSWVRRIVFAAVVVGLTIGPALIMDAGAFWDSAVSFHTSTEPRTDSGNVVGLLSLMGVQWAPSTLVPLSLGIGAAIWAGIGSQTHRSFCLALAFSLAASFLVSSQAFGNYWFMVFGLSALALLGPVEQDSPPS